LPLPLYLAPLRGVTDYIFRSVYAAHFKGYDGALAPFISTVKGNSVKLTHIKDILPENNRTLPVVPQIIGNNPEEFIILAEQLFAMGYSTVNWNVGCPFPQVTRKKRGAGLLPFPDKIDSFLKQVLTRIPNRVSIKTRLGLNLKSEMQRFIPVFNSYPLAEIIVHPRTAKQMYSGNVDKEGFEEFAATCKHPMVYNGDITTPEVFAELTRRFPSVDRWMIGRGAITNPFFAESLRGIHVTALTPGQRLKSFHDALFEEYRDRIKNPGNVLDKLKGVWFYLAQALPESKTNLKRIQKARKLDHYSEIVWGIFEELPR